MRPVGGLGFLVWQSLGPEAICQIHEHKDTKQIRDDLDEPVMDEDYISTLAETEQEKHAKILEINSIARIHEKLGDARNTNPGY